MITGPFCVIVAERKRFTTYRIIIVFFGAPFYNNSSDFTILFQVAYRILIDLGLTRSTGGE